MGYIPYESIGITVAVIAVALAFIVLTWNAVKAIREWRQALGKQTAEAIADLKKRVSSLEECCEEVHGKLQCDWQFQQDEKEFNVLVLEAIGQLLKHATDGDDVDGLRDVDRRINKYLLEQSQK